MVKIFLDTARVDEMRHGACFGVLVGVSTHRTLVAKTGWERAEGVQGVGRLDDMGQEEMQVVGEIAEIFRNYDWDCEILVASIRHPLHVIEAAKLGADIVTLPFDVLKKMTQHALTDVGLKRFLDDWQKVPK